MARLSPSLVLETIVRPKNKTRITEAQKDESRIIMHTEPVRDLRHIPASPFDAFITWVGTFLPKQKVDRFKQLVTTPIDTVESTKGIFDELSKFMDAQDIYVKYDFSSDTLAADFNDYLKQIEDDNYWRTIGWETVKSAPCSFLVVDLAQKQESARPEPYYYIVNIFSVVDVDINPLTGNVEYLMFKRLDGKVVCLDDEFYRVCAKPDDTGEWMIEFENRHSTFTEGGKVVDGLGYTPACSFYDVPVYQSGRISKRGPISDTVGKLDWILFVRTSKRYLDLYGAWPIIYSYKSECGYQDKDGNQCTEGYVTTQTHNGVDGGFIRQQVPCPACTARSLIGPGSYAEVDSPKDSTDSDLLDNGPIKFVEMSNDKLEYWVTEVERLENEVYLNCVGSDGNAMNTQAVNENQVQANFESKDAILDRIAVTVAKTRLFGVSTVARLRYGKYFLSGIVDYGRERFLTSVDDLIKKYKDAKAAGMPLAYMATLREQITKTQFKNNPEQQQRDYILRQIEPWPDFSIAECATFKDSDPLTYLLKVNFTTFVQRFEREQMNVVEFGSLTDFNTKINLITQKLQDYVNDRFATATKAASAQSESIGNGGAANSAAAGGR